MSTHFKHFITVLCTAAVLLVASWFGLRRLLGGQYYNHAPTILRKNDKEAVSYNSNTHILTVQTPTGTKTEYTRNPVIHISKAGVVTVQRKLFGFERSPFIGLGYSDSLRGQLGVSWAYAWRFDVNTQLAISTDKTLVGIKPATSLSYNFYRNTSLFIGFNPLELLLQRPPEYHIGFLVRL
jgi:hypothetical protein